MKQIKLITLLLLFLPIVANGQAIRSLADIERADIRQEMAATEGELSVIIGLRLPHAARAASQRGEWENLNNYIDRVQRELASEMGWRNFNDLVRYEHIPAMAAEINRDEARRLLQSRHVEKLYANQWNQTHLEESTRMVGLAEALARAANGAEQTVAVVDTGVDLEHPFVQARLVGGACFSVTKSCPNGERRDFGPQAGGALARHGSHVAGIAGGANNEFSGVAPGASLLSLQVFSRIENRIGAADSDIIAALDWLYGQRERHNIAAVNLSLGSNTRHEHHCDDDSVYAEIFEMLHQAGIVVVVASGNESRTDGISSPACVSHALAVGSLEKNGRISGFSNSGPILDIVAPGGDINSSVPGGSYARLSGTSMAAPHVAGAVASLRSAYPDASADDIVRALTENDTTYRDPRNGHASARLDLVAALSWLEANLRPPPAPEPPPEPEPAPEPAPEPEPQPEPDLDLPLCKERIDGILIERDPPCRKGDSS
ncbi:S8 family peptidase [Wenzhouxiangella sp. EGI_FJ10305]|uniref:S8 family peptidase n=1 Tax=Wenzhouxiangella sp. EGI_FJ10305 TaxID=3243768 RepID=UPI0035E3BBF7